jgi:hypothetical protein
MLLPGQLTEESELHDESLRRKRQAVYAYFIGAGLTITIPPCVAEAVRHYMG